MGIEMCYYISMEVGHEIWLLRWRSDVSFILNISVIISIERVKQYTYDLALILLTLTSA